jgi:hypothetical protein
VVPPQLDQRFGRVGGDLIDARLDQPRERGSRPPAAKRVNAAAESFRPFIGSLPRCLDAPHRLARCPTGLADLSPASTSKFSLNAMTDM